jgi:hypothetical protein
MNSKFILRWIAAFLLIVGFGGFNNGCRNIKREYALSIRIFIANPAALDRKNEAVFLNVAEIKAKHPEFNPDAFIVVSDGDELASQADDLNGDGSADQIVFESDFKAKQNKALTLHFAKHGVKIRPYPKRTQAELSHKFGGRFVNRKYQGGTFRNVQSLRVPPEHTDHSFFIRYEGPGWESDKIGYRFYLDWRNAIDLFGKKTPDMVLQNVGQDGFDSYHAMADWGMDILKVGESLGIGSLGMWLEHRAERVSKTDSTICTIVANGPVFSQIRTQYFGWKAGSRKYDLVSDLSITAGSRLTRHTVHVRGNPPNCCTGIVKLDSTQTLNSTGQSGNWVYLATYGKQSLADDQLGMAVLFLKKDLLQTKEDGHSHVVVLKPEGGALTYYFLAAWEQEPNGIRSAEAFVEYLEETASKLDAPLAMEL